MLAAFTYRDFRVQWFGACTSSIGTWMQIVAQNWLVLSLTGSPFFLGLDAFLQQLPIMLFTLIGGVLADRHDRRRTLLALAVRPDGDVGRARRCSSTSTSSRSGTSCCCRSSPACAQAFGGPAYQSLIPSLVDKKDLPNAVALNSIQFNVARVLGPLLFGATLVGLRQLGLQRAAGDERLLRAQRAVVPRRDLHADVAAREAHPAGARHEHARRAAGSACRYVRASRQPASRSSCSRRRRRSSGLRC